MAAPNRTLNPKKSWDCTAFLRDYVETAWSPFATSTTSRMELFWINRYRDGNLAIMPAPRAAERLEDIILGWRTEGIDYVVCLLEPSEIPGLVDLENELCREFGMEFL